MQTDIDAAWTQISRNAAVTELGPISKELAIETVLREGWSKLSTEMFELVTGVDMTQHAASDVWTPPKAEPNLAGKLSSLSPESLRFIRQSLENRMSY